MLNRIRSSPPRASSSFKPPICSKVKEGTKRDTTLPDASDLLIMYTKNYSTRPCPLSCYMSGARNHRSWQIQQPVADRRRLTKRAMALDKGLGPGRDKRCLCDDDAAETRASSRIFSQNCLVFMRFRFLYVC